MSSVKIQDEVILMNYEKGLLYGLDDIGSAIYGMIAEPTRVSELCDKLSVEYGAEPSVVQRDLLNLLDALSTHGLIVVTGENP
ncbi:MAG: PqqD family protein [Terriglobia bacterium]